MSYNEQAHLLGPRRSLLTITTQPSRSPHQGPAVVCINTGIVHRVGHHRMYVELARLLASTGRLVVRFDLSGIGDSAPRHDGTPPLAAGVEDIRIVLDWLRTVHKVEQVVLVGLCAGADQSVLYAADDARVVGLVLLDPSVPPTPRYYYHYILQRLGSARSWLSVLTGRSGLLRSLTQRMQRRPSTARELRALTLQELPFSPYLRQCYRRLAARSTGLLTVFTSVSARHTYHQQILDAFPEAASGGSLRLEYFGDSDHVFSQPESRARLFRVIRDWLELKDTP